MTDTTTITDLIAAFMAQPSATNASKLADAVEVSDGSLVFKPKATDAENTVLPFGKFSGMTLGELAQNEPDYFSWLAGLDDISKPSLKSAIQEVANGSA